MKESIKFKDELMVNSEGTIKINHTSAKMVGEVTIEEVDPLGNVVFTSTEYNDLTIGGATFILEQMFKRCSDRERFNLSGLKQWENISNLPQANKDYYIESERVFGFMVGIGGEYEASIKDTDFSCTKLDEFIPIRMIDANGKLNEGESEMYTLNNPLIMNGNSYNGYYVKKFTNNTNGEQDSTVDIIPEYTDGSGEVTLSNMNLTDSPIFTYAKIVMEIDNKDVREYFRAKDGLLDNCRINQLGLVAGKPTSNNSYDDVRLVTIVNFKGRDLSNDENKIRFRYKIYCM